MRQKEHDKVFLFLYDNKKQSHRLFTLLGSFYLAQEIKKSRDEGKKSNRLTFKTTKIDKVRMT